MVSPLSIFGYTISGVVEPVTLSDPALDAYVRQLLGRSGDSALTTADLWSITELTVPTETSNLEDLTYFTGLTALVIQGKENLDLSFLAQMPGAHHPGSGQQRDFCPGPALVGSLGKLTSLNLAGCSLSTPVRPGGLTASPAWTCRTTAFGPGLLAGCKGLTTLNLQRNAIASFWPSGQSVPPSPVWISPTTPWRTFRRWPPARPCNSWTFPATFCPASPALAAWGANRARNGSYNQLTEVTGLGSCAALV